MKAVDQARHAVRATLEAEGRASRARLARLQRSLAADQERMATDRHRSDIVQARIAGAAAVLKVGFLARWLSRRDLREMQTLEARQATTGERIRKASVRCDREKAFLTRAKRLHRMLGLEVDLPPISQETTMRFVAIGGRARDLVRQERHNPCDSIRLADDLHALIRQLPILAQSDRRDELDRQAALVARPVTAMAKAVPAKLASMRIHLPIPRSMWGAAKSRGALIEQDDFRLASPYYVEGRMDLEAFRDMLPSVFRRNKDPFSFPPIRHGASGQNLWSMFDADTWNHVRRSSYAMTGHRCEVCGDRGGYIAKKLFPDGRRDGVECHEVWDWTVDKNHGFGVQALRKLLVLCVSCHATFHESYFRSLARRDGVEDQVAAFIQHRRMAMNDLDAPALNRQLMAEQHEMAMAGTVRDWVVDLGHLAGQQFMASRVPVFRAQNPAGVDPEAIAGMAFETDDGFAYRDRNVDDVLRSVIAKAYGNVAAMGRLPRTGQGASS